jgi:8-oxo-dGTP pyrophosphatase MutT (NUDIX family)
MNLMTSVPTKTQVSAGGVAYRRRAGRVEVALISVGSQARWQLPKGLVMRGEQPEAAALREVREEAGVECELVAEIEQIEYWYFAVERGARVRYHKFVHFYLLRYLGGDVRNHDHEVNEARWFDIEAARTRLAFKNERQVVARAQALLAAAEA